MCNRALYHYVRTNDRPSVLFSFFVEFFSRFIVAAVVFECNVVV